MDPWFQKRKKISFTCALPSPVVAEVLIKRLLHAGSFQSFVKCHGLHKVSQGDGEDSAKLGLREVVGGTTR